MPFSQLNERSQGQSSGVTRRDGGRRKSDDWSTGQNDHHALEKFKGESSVWTKLALEPDRRGQPAPEKDTHP